MSFLNPLRKKFEEVRVGEIRFLGEQDGPPLKRLASKPEISSWQLMITTFSQFKSCTTSLFFALAAPEQLFGIGDTH
jgi:hypothetical protein